MKRKTHRVLSWDKSEDIPGDKEKRTKLLEPHQSLQTNLFNENIQFFFQDLVLTKEMYKKLLTRRLSLVGTLNALPCEMYESLPT